MSTTWKARLVDLVERTTATFAQSFLATITVQRDLSERTALYTALVAGAYATGKFLLGKANAYLKTTPGA